MVAVLPSRAATRSIAWVTFFLAPRRRVSLFELRQRHGRQDVPVQVRKSLAVMSAPLTSSGSS